mmetsp:Transcript_21319/g.41361  ORF Transcript_21319/g.41361 Transcript_21319/m.41361 type:complete len:247 (-) Transcript_21319:8-748(-)
MTDHVRNAPLDQHKLLGLLGNKRSHLECTGACAHHPHALALQAHAVVPLRRVEHFTPKGTQALIGGYFRHIQLTYSRDNRPKLPHFRPFLRLFQRRDLPRFGVFVPHGLLHIRVEADVLHEAVGSSGVLQVLPDLPTARALAAPVRRDALDGVGRCGGIARDARVSILVPCAPYALRTLENGEVFDALALQVECGNEARETGTDDGRGESPRTPPPRGGGESPGGQRANHGRPRDVFLTRRTASLL